jgi:hypothetical protein
MNASDQMLASIAAIAREVDTITDEGRASARRERLLIELDVAGVLADGARAHLVERDLGPLVAYHDAAVALRRYLASAARVRLVKTVPPVAVLEAAVSLDWFRVPSGYVAPGVEPDAWLALCEANFLVPRPTDSGERFVRLEGAIHRLLYRREVGPDARLWRALPA